MLTSFFLSLLWLRDCYLLRIERFCIRLEYRGLCIDSISLIDNSIGLETKRISCHLGIHRVKWAGLSLDHLLMSIDISLFLCAFVLYLELRFSLLRIHLLYQIQKFKDTINLSFIDLI